MYKGHFAFPVNNGAVWDPVKKVFRKKRANAPAIADIHCTLNNGFSMWVEVKNSSTGDRPSKKQKKFRENIISMGGYHIFCESYDHFMTYYRLNFTHL